MADMPRPPDLPDIPEAVAVPPSRWTVQLVWTIPLVAALIGGWLALKAVTERGPVVTISFESAEGLEAGKTKIKFKDVEVGLVRSIGLSEDAKRVIVTADLIKGTEPHLVEDTRFWVVRARISGSAVSGLGTLLSGAYIGVDLGKSGHATRDFVALKQPPVITSDAPGRQFELHGGDIGSLDIGSPVYFRHVLAGQIADYELDKDGGGVTLKVFVNAPYDRYVNANTRFWHASGFDVTLDSGGIKVNTQSLASILLGGLAFETPPDAAAAGPASADVAFNLFENRSEALKNPEHEVLKFVMEFRESVRGLALNAPIDFRGIVIGVVTAIKADINEVTHQITIPVEVDIYPGLLRDRSLKRRAALSKGEQLAFIRGMIANGLRGQLRTSNLVTNQSYIALDFFPNAPKIALSSYRNTTEMPTVPSSIQDLQVTIASIAKKIQDLPLDQISNDVRQTLQSANALMQKLDTELAPEARAALVDVRKALASTDGVLKPDSPLQQDARDALREIARAAQTFRVLADYLERHPEALLKGKKEDEK